MHLLNGSQGNRSQGNRVQSDSSAVPLNNAVLCIDCECVTSGLSDVCHVCGSHSLLGLARMLGGAQLSSAAKGARRAPNSSLLNVEIAVSLNRIEPRYLNDAVEGISNLIVASQGQARFHINVEPVGGQSSHAVSVRVA